MEEKNMDMEDVIANQMVMMFTEKLHRNFYSLMRTFERQEQNKDVLADEDAGKPNQIQLCLKFKLEKYGEMFRVFAPEMGWKSAYVYKDSDVWYNDIDPNQPELPGLETTAPKREWMPADAKAGTLEWLEWQLLYKVSEKAGKDIYFFPKVKGDGSVYKYDGHWKSFHAPDLVEICEMAVEHDRIVLVPSTHDGIECSSKMEMIYACEMMLMDEGVKVAHDIGDLDGTEKEAMDGKVCVATGYLPRKQ